MAKVCAVCHVWLLVAFMKVDGATVKLSARDIHALVQALRIASEDGSIFEYATKHQINQLNERLSNAK
jgi:hypothetical protein